MSSEFIRRPSTSKMQARIGGKVGLLAWSSDMAGVEVINLRFVNFVYAISSANTYEGTTGWMWAFLVRPPSSIYFRISMIVLKATT